MCCLTSARGQVAVSSMVYRVSRKGKRVVGQVVVSAKAGCRARGGALACGICARGVDGQSVVDVVSPGDTRSRMRHGGVCLEAVGRNGGGHTRGVRRIAYAALAEIELVGTGSDSGRRRRDRQRERAARRLGLGRGAISRGACSRSRVFGSRRLLRGRRGRSRGGRLVADATPAIRRARRHERRLAPTTTRSAARLHGSSTRSLARRDH